MICQNCQSQIPQESVFCPYCGVKVAQPAEQAQQQAQGAYFYPPQAAPGMSYQAATPVNQQEVDSAKTLGIVALVVGIFVPLVGFICGGIGLSKIKKLKTFADPNQQQSLNKSKKLCMAGIIVPAVLAVISIVLSIIWGVYIGRKIANEYKSNPYDDYSYYYSDDFENDINDFLEEYGIEQ